MRTVWYSIMGVFAGIALVFFWYFSLVWMVQFFILSVFFAALIVLVLSIFSSKGLDNFRSRWIYTTFLVLNFCGILITFTMSVIFYYSFSPAKIADIHISNGSQHVYFLQMSHIATEKFYHDKSNKLWAFAQSGATILIEWIQPGTPENTQRLHEVLTFKFSDTLYPRIASFLGFASQDNDVLFARIDSTQIRSVDISVDDIIGLLSGMSQSLSHSATLPAPVDIEAMIDAVDTSLTPREKNFYRLVVRAFLNAFLKHADRFDSMGQSLSAELLSVLIDARNAPVVEYVLTHPEETIIVPYGALHFEGILASLKSHDPAWRIVDIEAHAPYHE